MTQSIEWLFSSKPIEYKAALQTMEKRVQDISAQKAKELIWLLEHPPVYTLGTTGSQQDIIKSTSIPVYTSSRGGKATYHGPGQRVVYIMLDLKKRFQATGKIDIHDFVRRIESWIIDALSEFDIWSQRREGRVGLWVEANRPYIKDKNQKYSSHYQEKKIASIGLRIRKGVSYHGAAINVNPDLNAFRTIIPCGLAEFELTSLEMLNKPLKTYEPLDKALYKNFNKHLNFPL